jgi:hypothetical protein
MKSLTFEMKIVPERWNLLNSESNNFFVHTKFSTVKVNEMIKRSRKDFVTVLDLLLVLQYRAMECSCSRCRHKS